MREEHLLELLSEMEPGMEERARHRRTAAARVATGSSYAFFCRHGRLIACSGVTVYWPGMAEAWLLFGRHAFGHLVDIAYEAPLFLEELRREHGLRRIQADVVATNEKALSFARHYGFEPEGLMRKYDVLGRDNIRLSRIWEDEYGEPR